MGNLLYFIKLYALVLNNRVFFHFLFLRAFKDMHAIIP